MYGIYTIFYIWLNIEILFYIYIHFYLIPKIQPIKSGVKYCFEKPIKTFYKLFAILSKIHKYSFKDFFNKWCDNKPFIEKSGGVEKDHDVGFLSYSGERPYEYGMNIKNSHKVVSYNKIISWLSWVIYNESVFNLHPIQLKNVNKLSNQIIEKYYNHSTTTSTSKELNKNIQMFSLVPITHIHHPLFIYLLFWGARLCGDLIIKKSGFIYCETSSGLSYWYKESVNKTQTPIIMFHGISFLGWYYYYKLIKGFNNRTIILINYKGILINSLCIKELHYLTNPFIFSKNILEIIHKYNLQEISVIGHSWGTFLVKWAFLQKYTYSSKNPITKYIKNITLIDPVALSVFLPETTNTILYSSFNTLKIVDLCICYFIKNDLTISYNLQRHFEWYNTVIFLDEIPKHINLVIGISIKDNFMDSLTTIKIIKEFIKKCNNKKRTKLIIWKNLQHSDAIVNNKTVKQIKNAIFEKPRYKIYKNKNTSIIKTHQ
jgi:hypothetical protein